MNATPPLSSAEIKKCPEQLEKFVLDLVSQMTLDEKIGQMTQLNGESLVLDSCLREQLRTGKIGSIINQVDLNVLNELQRIVVEESRLGIPLLVGRDVIHGFNTIHPIPLGQAATWNPGLVTELASFAALEAASNGINWTFSPMVDICRDPRWGRIAESFGEDPYLTSTLGAAMISGYQSHDMSNLGSIAACAKHFVGYGAVESGRDYATTNIPENELRNIYLTPFHASVKANVASIMTSFSDLNGVPATANPFILRQVLRDEWQFSGLVVSDWDSVRQLEIHGLTANAKESACEAVSAGIDMEMVGDAYSKNLASLVHNGVVDEILIDKAVANILRIKAKLGLFNNAKTDPKVLPSIAIDEHLQLAKEAAIQSVVLLQNNHETLPLAVETLNRVALLGPLANAPHEQLGTWIFDGKVSLAQTPLQAFSAEFGERLYFHPVLKTSRSKDLTALTEVIKELADCDLIVVCIGEESILSGEAHSRADIGLPGAQTQLLEALRKLGKPVVCVVMAGRPLTLTSEIALVDALLYAWHPGVMAGPAIADLLVGRAVPSGKLPVTFVRHVGQIPLYYNQKNTGKPPSDEEIVLIDDIEERAPQTSLGMTAFHLDEGFRPLFPFGFGLSYTRFHYSELIIENPNLEVNESLRVSVKLSNTGSSAGVEVVQCYIRDHVGSVTRPVRELKGFQRVSLAAGESRIVSFIISPDQLAFYGRDQRYKSEPGSFTLWVGGDSNASLNGNFILC